MGWSIGYDNRWHRDIGYGVPAFCDHPDCWKTIDRGLGYVCGGEPYGGERGCGLFFCGEHGGGRRCPRCENGKPWRKNIAPEHPQWLLFKVKDRSWKKWRAENPGMVSAIITALRTKP